VAVVSKVEEHDQRTVVVATHLLANRASVLNRHIDHDHICRRPTLGQLNR
jgi:hypothetical protein